MKKKSINSDDLINRLLSLMEKEITKIEKKQYDQLLDSRTTAALTEHIRTLVQLKKEERMLATVQEASKMSESELIELAKQAIAYSEKNP